MKNLVSKLKEKGKSWLSKTALITGGIGLIFSSYLKDINAKEYFSFNPKETQSSSLIFESKKGKNPNNPEADSLNGPTPFPVISNMFSQPNITMQIGLDTLEWYGSGDVNLDNKIDSLDLEEMNNGTTNNMADVDGDGIPSTQSDKSVLSEYLNGIREYLPGHWNELKTPEERIDWFQKMSFINDGLNGLPPGWVCADYINQMELDFYGCSNYLEGYQNGRWDSLTHIDSVAKFNLPLYWIGTTNTSGVGHAAAGILVGRRIDDDSVSFNPLDFYDWYFLGYNNDERVYPGNFNMSENNPVSVYKTGYYHNPIFNYNLFDLTGPFITWNLNNGVPTLANYIPFNGEYGVILENPNLIKVYLGELEDLVLNGGEILPDQTSLTPEIIESLGYNGVPDTTKENTVLPINLEYTDRDTTWLPDSTSFSFNRHFYGWIYSGGYTKWDTTSQNLSIENLIGPSVLVDVSELDSIEVDAGLIPPGQELTPEYLESIGFKAIPDTTKENTNLPMFLNYEDSDTTWSQDSTSKWFDRSFYGGVYSFGDTLQDTSIQNIKITNLPNSLEEIVSKLPKKYEISQNYPNPFNPSTIIRYEIPEMSTVSLIVYDILGNEVAVLADDEKDAGIYTVEFSTDKFQISSGVYFYRLAAKSKLSDKHFIKVGKMILLR
ncbi:MAG: hypothetical protein Kow0098_26210 [Ignavibacteriaceae bacterium]